VGVGWAIIGSVMTSWSIRGAEQQLIIGNAHVPEGGTDAARGTIVIAHGFKGYKDYGMFPRIAEECARRGGLIAHRFNFSHNGMTNRIENFERPDLFERDTFGKQVFDLTQVIEAIAHGELEGRGLRLFLLGHSRGGVTALLTAAHLTYLGRWQRMRDIQGDPTSELASSRCPAGVITLAAPSSCNPFTPDEQHQLLEQGWLESPSSRTGQKLRIGRAFLQEQLDDPAAHELLAHVARIQCPILIIHGENDPTVPAQCAERIAAAAGDRAQLRIVKGADHVFNTPNPLPDDQPSSLQLAQVIDAVIAFITKSKVS
jgi:uncharacterized protein